MKKLTIVAVFIISASCAIAQTLQFTNKILVVSGGGARGAWGIGVAQRLFENNNKQGYKAVFGTSTGSLMSPFVFLQKFDVLQSVYTNVNGTYIFNVNPFKLDTTGGNVTTKIKMCNAIWRAILGKKTLGESKNLRKLIQKNFSSADFNEIRKYRDSTAVAVGVMNMTTGNFELKSSQQISDYHDFVNWIWASANEPVFMSYYHDKVSGNYYSDGGLRQVIPLQDAIGFAVKNNIDTIDVIINNKINPQENNWNAKQNYIFGLFRILDIYGSSTQYNNLTIAEQITRLLSSDKFKGLNLKRQLILNIYSMPPELADTYKDELGFVKSKMTQLYQFGYGFEPMGQTPTSMLQRRSSCVISTFTLNNKN